MNVAVYGSNSKTGAWAGTDSGLKFCSVFTRSIGFAEMIDDAPVHCLSVYVKRSTVRNESLNVAIHDGTLDREGSRFPPIVEEIEVAGCDGEIEVAKAIVAEHSPIH